MLAGGGGDQRGMGGVSKALPHTRANLPQQIGPVSFHQAGGEVGGAGAMPVVANSHFM
jgi:hypothetical protein